MMIKTNPYSDRLQAALSAVADMGHPDFSLLPIDPSPRMLANAGHNTGLPHEILRQAYYALINAWLEENED